MKNKLLVTTAIVATAFTTHAAMAEVVSDYTIYENAYTADGKSDVRGGVFEFRDGASFEDTATFTNNSTTGDLPNNGFGGAIFTDYTSTQDVVFKNNAVFTGNTAIAGGAIYNEAGIQFDSSVTFSNNYASAGGALGNNAGGTIIFNGEAVFENNGKNGENITEVGGAIANNGTINFAQSATFTGNQSTNQGSSISNSGTITFNQGLTATYNTGTYTGIANGGTLNVTGGDVIITDNTTNRSAGIMNNGLVNFTNVGKVNFTNNKATGSSAGALGVNDSGAGVFLSADTINFDSNSSTGNGYGGAIFTAGNLSILGTTNNFSNNTSTTTSYGSKDEWRPPARTPPR